MREDGRFGPGPAHGLTWDEYNIKFGTRIANLEELVRTQRDEIAKLERDALTGRHFLSLMQAVKTNKLVKKEWDRFMMSLRLCGMDKATVSDDNE